MYFRYYIRGLSARLQPTYEELKLQIYARPIPGPTGLQPTYEELKPGCLFSGAPHRGRLQPTYEELKLPLIEMVSSGLTGFTAYL